jgi:glycogen debranching enzyme
MTLRQPLHKLGSVTPNTNPSPAPDTPDSALLSVQSVQSGLLEEKALARLIASRRSGYDPFYRFEYEYSIPSPGRYRWQWFWDSCFHIIALARLNPAMAEVELNTLLKPQRDDGFIGHLTYWGRRGAVMSAIYGQSRFGEWRRRHSGMIQPPVLAHALEELWLQTGDLDLLKKYLPRVRAYYNWLSVERDPEQIGLIGIVSPYEAGLDNNPSFDRGLGLSNAGRIRILWANRKLDWYNIVRGKNFDYRTLLKRDRFVAIDPFMNSVFGDSWAIMARLHEALGDTSGRESAARQGEKTTSALNERCWDLERGHYTYLIGAGRSPDTTLSVGAIFPLILRDAPKDRVAGVVEQYLTAEKHFWRPFPVPSVAASEPAYNPESEKMIWRGPICINLNWLLARGLRAHGYVNEARTIADRSKEAALKDFREFYSPESGRGMRGTEFGWATAAVAIYG